MPKSIIIKKNGGPEVLELQDVNVGSPGPDEIKVTNANQLAAQLEIDQKKCFELISIVKKTT